MDIIHHCLGLVPVSCLLPAFSILRFIWSSIQQVQGSRQQLGVLAESVAQLLNTLDTEYSAGRLSEGSTSEPLEALKRLLEGISIFVQKEATYGFLKSLYVKDQRIQQIEAYHRLITTSINSFEAALVNIQAWQSRNDEARATDQQALNDRLNDLESNHNKLVMALNAKQDNMIAMMVSLQRRVEDTSDGDRERQFFSHTLRYLTTASGRQVEVENWMITPYEVEFGPEIGSGGFGQVFSGTWNKMEVALKVLKTDSGVTPTSMSIRREVDTWSKMRHPHVLQFIGANISDERPFIVTPYLKNGNVREYILNHPDCNRIQILHHISLGLVYLHSQKIVHGDLKALNVLIDDSEKAVLCDFGLSRVKADATSRDVGNVGNTWGSRNWMAPERLLGGSVQKSSDMYAFGMTVYELYTGEIPLGHILYTDFIELVARLDVRPERPSEEDSPYLLDTVWELAEQCWVKDPTKRPTANTVCDILARLPQIIVKEQATLVQTRYSTSIPTAPQPSPPPSRIVPRAYSLCITPTLAMRGHSGSVSCVTFSPDGKRIASGSVDKTLLIWDASTAVVVLGPLEKHTKTVWSIAFSPDGKQIATGSEDKTIRIWDAFTGKKSAGPFKGHTNIISSLAFSPDGQQLASGSADKSIRVWNSATNRKVDGHLKGHTNAVHTLAFSPDGKRIVSGSWDTTIRVWDTEKNKLISGPLQRSGYDVGFALFSLDGLRVFSASRDRQFCIWDAQSGALLSSPSAHQPKDIFPGPFASALSSSCIAPGARWLATGFGENNKTVSIWDSETGTLGGIFDGHSDLVCTFAFSPDGRQIVTGSADTTIRVCNLTW